MSNSYVAVMIKLDKPNTGTPNDKKILELKKSSSFHLNIYAEY